MNSIYYALLCVINNSDYIENNEPIIKKTFEIIKKSKIFNEIVLSSDSDKILNLGKKIGFTQLIKRPKILSDDYIGTDEVIVHAIKILKEKINISNVCCIYPCNPFLQISDLKKAFKLIKNNKRTFVLSISNYTHPIERGFVLNKKNNRIKNINSKFIKFRTQDITSKYFDAGQFYFGKSSSWESGLRGTGVGGAPAGRLDRLSRFPCHQVWR